MVRGIAKVGLVRSVLAAVLINTFLGTAGCGPQATDEYDRTFNEERKSRGLPFIPTTWIERKGGPQADWANPEFQDPQTCRKPMHTSKDFLMDRDTGKPLREYDFYQSGKMYHVWGSDPGQLSPQTLTITYDYEAERAGKDPWHCEVDCGPDESWDGGREMTLQEAEVLLEEWGLKRLNYRIESE